MNVRIAIVLAFLLAGGWASGADLITATLSVTNTPIGNTNTFVVAASTRTFTNNVTTSPGTLVQQTNSVSLTATQILNHLTAYPARPGHLLSQSTASNVTIRGLPGEALSVSVSVGWATVTYSTQSLATPTFIVRMPLTVEAATNQTNIASALIAGLQNSTNAVGTNWTAGTNYLTRGAHPGQYVASPVQFAGVVRIATAGQATNLNLVNATNSGIIGAVTNGVWTNGVLLSPKLTNGVNYGNALSSPGLGTGSEQFGTGATTTTNFGTAVGNGALAGWGSFAGGYLASAGSSNGVAVGGGAEVTQMDGTAVGQSTSVDGYRGNAFGYRAVVDTGHQLSTAIGANTTTTGSNQVRLGSSTATVSIPGVVAIEGSQTNTTFRGTNVFNGRLDFKPGANTSLANGFNSGVVLGTNVYLRLSGHSAAVTNAGFAAEQDGSYHVLQFDNPVSNLTILNASGLEATAGNRILTGTGGDLNLTNQPVIITTIYDANSSRWRLISWTR